MRKTTPTVFLLVKNVTRSMMPVREKGEFYKKDRKVLRFFCKYKDSRLQGDKRDYILYYYLLNDTVEIKEVNFLHCYLLVFTDHKFRSR